MSLLSLPDDLVGYIFCLLSKDERRAFFCSCKQLHNARSICQQYSTLTIFADQLHSSSGSSNPFLCFPEGAQLKKLVLERPRGSAPNDDPGSLLLQLLQPTQVKACLQNLEEVHFKGFHLTDMASAEIGGFLGSNTRLRALEIEACNDDFAPLLRALAAPGSMCALRGLHLTIKYTDGASPMPASDSIQAISKLVSLDTLSFVLFGTEQLLPDPPLLASYFAPLSALTQLRSLNIKEEDAYVDIGDFRYAYIGLGDLSFTLRHLKALQFLALPELPSVQELAVLPTTLQSLEGHGLHETSDMQDLCDSLIDVASHIHRLPRLRSIRCLGLTADCDPVSNYAALPQALSALSHVHLSLESVIWADFDALLNFFNHAQPLAKTVQRIMFLPEPEQGSSEANFARLGELCPSLTSVAIHTDLPNNANEWDPACLFGARHLHSLRELRLIFSGNMLDSEELGLCSHGVLSLAIAMRAKKGPPLTIVLEGRMCGQDSMEAEVDILHLQWASICRALISCLDCHQCDVHLQSCFK